MSFLALDIGGANLKAADGNGFALSRFFALWRAPQRLGDELGALVADAPAFTRLAVTMTAELADCYETKAAGVTAILAHVERIAASRPVSVYLVDGRLATLQHACETPQLAAASNWHALASFANRYVHQWPAMLLDVGSTTTDIIPLHESGPCPTASDDTGRLLSNELVYMGVDRTPVNTIVRLLPVGGRLCPVAAELFATAADAYLLLGLMPEEPLNRDTADGRPRSRACAHARIARMVCADATTFSAAAAGLAATAVRDAQLTAIESAVRLVAGGLPEAPRTLILSGQGEFLLRLLVERLPWRPEVISLASELGPDVSRCSPAHALAVLARERMS